MSLRNRFGVFFFALTFVTAYASAFAEQSTTDGPCATPDARSPVLESFSMVHPTAVTAITSTINAELPEDLITDIFTPGNEVSNRITYDRKSKGSEFTNELFLVKGGVEAKDPFAFIKVRVTKVDTLCRSDTATTSPTTVPERDLGRWVSVLLKGKIIEGVAVFGNPKGDDYTFSFAYTVEKPKHPEDPLGYKKCADGTNVSDHPYRDLNSVDPGRASDYRDCADDADPDDPIAFKIHPGGPAAR